MVSLTTASNYFLPTPFSLTDLNTHAFPSWVFVFNPRRRVRKQKQLGSLNLVAAALERGSGGSFLAFLEGKKRNYGDFSSWCGGFVRRCKKDWDGEGNLALEAEILEFMRNSENPEAFPSKKQLMDAGRVDLVDAIARQGGWLAFGWDFDDEDKEEEQQQQQLEGVQENEVTDWDLTMMKEYKNGALQERVEISEKSSALEGNEVRRYGVSSFAVNSSGLASSSGRSLKEAIGDDSGIEGILSRLEKERNINFGFGLREKGNTACVQSDGGKDDWRAENSKEETVAGLGRICKLASFGGGIMNNSGGKLSQNASLSGHDGLRSSLKQENWRTWSIQRAGFPDTEFEAAEIASNGAMDVSGDEILELRGSGNEHLNKQEELNSCPLEINHNDIRSRVQQLELELSTVLHTLRSNTVELPSQEGYEGSPDDFQELSDAWEFQENEIMNSRDRLRSIRAKLVVLEGKMALAIIDAQKVVEEKQKRIDDARRALRLIHTACIVWPNSASEVLLAGSFDGWASQRKMEKSSTGIFSLCLKLYPGRYQIKFIVDGEWKIDPLRPIVHNNEHENNLLIVT